MIPDLHAPHDGERIAIVSHVHPSIQRGGAELSAYAAYQGLAALGRDVIFIAAVPEDRRGDLALGSDRELAVYHDPENYDHFYHLGSGALRDELIGILIAAEVTLVNFHHFMHFGINTIRAVAERPEFQTVMTLHEYLAICNHHGQMITRQNRVLCEAATLPSCISCYPEHSRQQFAIRRDHFLEAFAQIDGFISPSHFLAKRYAEWGIPADRLRVVENGLNHVPKLAPPRRRRAGDDSWVFGFFGQITPFKGVATLLEVAALVAEHDELTERIKIRVHGNMVGQGQAFLDRFDEAVSTHPFLSYRGTYGNRDVGRLMAECDYVVVPSLWWENSPVVIQEAYAIGRPVIVTGIGGMAEKVIDGVTGLHFGVGDHIDLLRVFELAADQQTYDALLAQLPQVLDAVAMAQAYDNAFNALTSPGADHAVDSGPAVAIAGAAPPFDAATTIAHAPAGNFTGRRKGSAKR
jgi:glycosyltransferase involved in cell wall biosynthesis